MPTNVLDRMNRKNQFELNGEFKDEKIQVETVDRLEFVFYGRLSCTMMSGHVSERAFLSDERNVHG
jgi:hypothetical protein